MLQHSSYLVDPQWQRKFSIILAAGVGLAVLLSVPNIARAFRTGRLFRGVITGVTENTQARSYAPAGTTEVEPPRPRRRLSGIADTLWSATLWSLPGIELDLGQSTFLSPACLASCSYPLIHHW